MKRTIILVGVVLLCTCGCKKGSGGMSDTERQDAHNMVAKIQAIDDRYPSSVSFPSAVVNWPEVVVDPNYEYEGEFMKERAVADGLVAWATCMAGNDPPQNFGRAMIKVGKVAGVSPTHDNLMAVTRTFPVPVEIYTQAFTGNPCDPNDPSFDMAYKFLQHPTRDWTDKFGANERTLLIHAISELRVVVAAQGQMLIDLEARVVILEPDPNSEVFTPLLDPNEVKE